MSVNPSDKKGRRRKRKPRGKEAPFYTHRRRVFCPTDRPPPGLNCLSRGGGMADHLWGRPRCLDRHPPSPPISQSQPPLASLPSSSSANSLPPSRRPRSGSEEMKRTSPAICIAFCHTPHSSRLPPASHRNDPVSNLPDPPRPVGASLHTVPRKTPPGPPVSHLPCCVWFCVVSPLRTHPGGAYMPSVRGWVARC
ncbi:hypothetical protein VTN77DRAFT_8132 [Rasamsonia byssochlamydoides]|uniref:uncharacterized protein n=1 Tax=Rasamsonia byssochlamydoides TaxID=89139 RepID=UPI003743BC24